GRRRRARLRLARRRIHLGLRVAARSRGALRLVRGARRRPGLEVLVAIEPRVPVLLVDHFGLAGIRELNAPTADLAPAAGLRRPARPAAREPAPACGRAP